MDTALLTLLRSCTLAMAGFGKVRTSAYACLDLGTSCGMLQICTNSYHSSTVRGGRVLREGVRFESCRLKAKEPRKAKYFTGLLGRERVHPATLIAPACR